MHAAILSNHRSVSPFRLNGGEGARNGQIEERDGIMMTEVQKEGVLVIEASGRGGYGLAAGQGG